MQADGEVEERKVQPVRDTEEKDCGGGRNGVLDSPRGDVVEDSPRGVNIGENWGRSWEELGK
eukprot:9161147-Prorocentrum_lima.AAC.1